MPMWTTAADVTDRWVDGEVPASCESITVLLEDAEDAILGEFPDMQARIDRAEGLDASEGESVPLRRVVKVAARIVMRHLRNPSGERSRQEVQGPFARNITYGGDEPGALYLTADDRGELGGRQARSAFTIDTAPELTPVECPW